MNLSMMAAMAVFQVVTAQAPATSVAVVNVVQVSERYQRTKDLESQFGAKRDQIRAEADRLRQEIEQKRRILAEQLEPGSEAFNATREELVVLEAKAEFFMDAKMRELDAGLAQSLRLIYRDIQAAVAEVARERGIQIVLAADELPPDVPESPTTAKQHIILQKVVYWNPQVELTEDVINRLNSRYTANRGNSQAAPMTPTNQ